MDVHKLSKAFVLACYGETKQFPPEEKYGICRQIRRAALSVHLNIAEGCSRKSLAERKRFYEIARGSLIEVDAAFEISVELNMITKEKLTEAGNILIRCFQVISKMM